VSDWGRYAKIAVGPVADLIWKPEDAEFYDPAFRLRYGVTSGEKYRQAVTGAIPGALPVSSEKDVEREERRAAGYLFAKEHPTISAAVQPAVNALRTHAFGDDPAVVAAANEGQAAALRPQKMASFDNWDDAALHLFGGR
jgi:hypothetical protein